MEPSAPTPWPRSLAARTVCCRGVGGRCGGHVDRKIAEQEARAGREAVIVTILCDSADKYLSERFCVRVTAMLKLSYADYRPCARTASRLSA